VRHTAFFGLGFVLLLMQQNFFRFLGLLGALCTAMHIPRTLVDTPGLVPSFAVPLILFMGVHEFALVRGAALAFLLGYFTDLIGIAPVGLYTFTYVGLFVLTRAAGLRFAAQTRWMQLLLGCGCALIQSIVVLGLIAIFGGDAWIPRAVYKMALPHTLATGLITPFIFKVAERVHVYTLGNPSRSGVMS
jgi:rod shape-determining protein MreD